MFYPEFTVTQKTLKNIGTVEYSRAIADSVKILPAWEKQLQKEALTSRIYSLLKIEGTGIDEQIIKASLEGFTDNKPQEVINFDAALKSVKEIGKKLELEEIDIKYINQTLTQRLMPKTKQGAYRTLKKTGKPDPGEILAKIVTLFDWLNSLDARENHPLITASILSAEILRLEPFENFNNSTASLAFDLVLESYGYSLGGLIEIDSYFLSSRKEFEEALTEIEKNNFDYTHWLEYVTHGISVKTYNLVEKIKLLGKHNLENVCASICVAKLAGVSNQNIAKVLEKFRGLEHRLEFVGEKNGVIFYNDSLATVPEAVIQALKTLPDTETLIAGGYDRGLDYSGIGEYLNKGQIKTLILFAPSGKRIWEEIRKATSEANRPEKFDVITMEQAVKIAAAETKPGKICLLSPASASFGTFKDYKDRGEQFKKAINEISNF